MPSNVSQTQTDRRTFLKGAGAFAASSVAATAALAEEPRDGKPDPGESPSSDRPKPINTGPSQAEGIARFASRAKYDNLSPEQRERLKVSVLDSLACAISALGAPPMKACLAQAKEFGGSDGRCTLIGGGQANAVYAASYNTALVRYIDFMDSYFAKGGLCHPSDNIGAILAASEHTDRSGKDFLTALAVAYQVETALTDAAPFMAHGFDQTTPLTYSLGAGMSKALGLDESKTAAAIEICGAAGIPLLVVRTTPISQWKGLNSSQVALGCAHGVFLASRGVTGPKYVIEGPNGLAQLLGETIRIDWDKQHLDCFDRLALKSYNSAVPTQSAIFCMLEMRKAHPFDPANVVSIEADVFQDAYDFTGGGKFGPKTDVHTKNDADHSLPYLLAVAGLDGDVQTAQLDSSRIDRPDVQALLRKVKVKPDNAFTARYPGMVPSRVTVQLEGGKSYSHEVKDYPGFPTRPFAWDEIVAKFRKLTEGRLDRSLADDVVSSVQGLESMPVAELTKLLARAKPAEG
jgi:2-methylcitrate dehydratase